MRKDYHWPPGQKRRGNPNWRKSDYQDVFSHEEPSETSSLILFSVIMLVFALSSCAK